MMKYLISIIAIFAMCQSVLSQNIELSIMSFNVQQPYGTNWDARKDSAVKIMKQQNIDIIGTQEAVNYQRDYLLDSTNGYAYFGLGRDGGDNGEGSWILYKTDKFELDSANSGDFWLSNTPDRPSRFAGNYNRICTYARFIDKHTQKAFYVFNAHFPVPDLYEGRMQSMRLLAKVMAEKSLNGDPVIATGDFNSNESNGVTKWIKNGEDNPFHCNDTYRDVYPEGSVTTGFGTKFDYVYCEKNANYKIHDSWVIKEPSGASDHYPIAASLTLFFSENGNKLPVANAGPDIHIIDSTASLNEYPFWLDASLSYDPDGLITSFEWYNGDDLLFSQGSSTLNLPIGNYPLYLKVTDNLGGIAYDQILITFDWFEEEIIGNSDVNSTELKIYPIPVTNTLNIAYGTNSPEIICLYSIAGTKLIEVHNQSELDMSMHKSGVYILTVKADNKLFTKKILKK